MNLAAIEELILMLMPPDDLATTNAKGMLEMIRKDPQQSLVRMLGSAPALDLDKSSWVYGLITGVAMSAASISPDMLKNFKR